MRYVHSIATAIASLLLVFPSTVTADGIYSKNSGVVLVDGKNYDSLIAKSNHTSIVEFYAPWCGHCQNLKLAYEKAAKALSGLAKVAAINCDEESNKPFCGSMGVQGFPTLKIVKPGKKPGRPFVEDYQGPRTAKGIVEAVKEKIPNHVKRVTDETLADWLQERNSTAKAILFSDKGVTSALLKALAIDFLGTIAVVQIRSNQKAAVETFGVTSYPTLVLLPGGTAPAITYYGEMNKAGMSGFLSQIAPANPDPAPKKAKSSKSSSKKTDKSKASSDSSTFASASVEHQSADASSARATQTSEVLEDSSDPTASPNPNVVDKNAQVPVKLPEVAPMIKSLFTEPELQQACLTTKSGICVLALLPSGTSTEPEALAASPDVSRALSGLSEIHHRHVQRKGKIFPFYAIPATNAGSASLRSALGLKDDGSLEVLAVHGKRGWAKSYSYPATDDLHRDKLETWIDAIRMGEGTKTDLPESLLVEPAPVAAPVVEEVPLAAETREFNDADFSDEELLRTFSGLSHDDVEQLLQEAKNNEKGREHGEL